MKLITEVKFEEIDYLTETKENGKKDYFIEGVFLQANIKNRNGRFYPINTMEREVERYNKDVIMEKRAMGELGHPEGPQINLDRVSHLITELKRSGNDFIGKAKLTSTPFGETARGLLESGVKLGVSSRGMGSLKPTNEGIMEVQSDFRLATAADIVADPSAPNAFVKGIMEGVEWIYDPIKDTWLEEKVHDVRKKIDGVNLEEEQKFALFESYLTSLMFKNRIL